MLWNDGNGGRKRNAEGKRSPVHFVIATFGVFLFDTFLPISTGSAKSLTHHEYMSQISILDFPAKVTGQTLNYLTGVLLWLSPGHPVESFENQIFSLVYTLDFCRGQ
jgi:hypothetical protein